MKTFKRICFALLFPPLWLVFLLVPAATVCLILAFTVAGGAGVFAYVSYALSAYALTVACCRAPAIVRWVKRFSEENAHVHRYLTDPHYRLRVGLFTALFSNAAYSVFQLALGIRHHTVWFYAFALYYLLLALMRFFLVRYTLRHTAGLHERREWKGFLLTGIALLVMNLALAVIVSFIVWQNRTFVHHPITTIALAAYTFLSFAMAIVNLVKYRKFRSPVYSASRAVGLAAAFVSVLTLTTAMLTAFGGEEATPAFRQWMTGLTGGAVLLCILIMAIAMTVIGARNLRALSRLEAEQ